MNNTERLERIINRLPYPDQIKNINLDLKDEIRFTWRCTRFKISREYYVAEIRDTLEVGSNKAILLKALLEI